MKKITTLVFLFFIVGAWPQEKSGVISKTTIGNIYKPESVEATEERLAELKMPDGFKISKFADDLGKARMMTVGPQGDVYVTSREGRVYRLKDTNNDGKADRKEEIITKEGAHGVTIHDGMFYLVTVKEVFRGKLNEDGSVGELEKIIDDLPDGGQHPNRTLKFGPDNMLYITVGSTCNACKETNKESATIVRANPDRNNRKVFAKGLRNTLGIDWHPETGKMYGVDHGIDWLGDDEQKEELNLIEEGKDYGWPYIYGDGKFNEADEPENMTWEEYAAKAENPELLFTAHSAPMDLIFYTGNMFPPEYKNNALVTFHGSWNRKPASGYHILHIDFENGKPVKSEDFVTGFLTEGGTAHFARPVAIVELQDGSVLVSDDSQGIIYRITYKP